MSDLERHPTRLNSQLTQVEEFEEDVQHHPKDESKRTLPPFSSNQRSSLDNPYNLKTRRQSIRIPNSNQASPLPDENKDRFEDIPWHCGNPYRYGAPMKEDAWQKCYKMTEKYDNEMCAAWKEEVDKLLIFAGLFSATITSFTIESYKWLSEGPEDVSARLLATIATQLSNSSSNPLQPNLILPPFSVSSTDVRINAVWFLSLTLGLTTVLIGILCLQWLREFQRDAALPHKESVALRQMRYEGLMEWYVPEILSALPLLLQLALILFFVGLLDLLWSRHTVVAACISALVGLVMFFLAATTALPALQHAVTKNNHLRIYQCPYKSPQSWLFYRMGHSLFWIFSSLNLPWSNFDSPRFHRLLKSAQDLNWMTFDMRWRHLRDAEEVIRGSAKKVRDSDDTVHALQWINDTFTQSVEAVYPIYHSLADLEIPAATTTVAGFHLERGQIDNATLRVMLDDRFSPMEYQKRDIISAFYLHLHQDVHPVLKTTYIESVIRILNSQPVPEPFYDWFSQILQEVVVPSSSSLDESEAVVLHIGSDIHLQILLCLKTLLAQNGLQILDVVVAWSLVHRLLSTGMRTTASAAPLDDDDDPMMLKKPLNGVNIHQLRLAGEIFEEFEIWLTKGKEIKRWERVKLCAEGMITVFTPPTDIVWLESLCPEMLSKACSLLRSLEGYISTFGGGPSAVLLRQKWSLGCWENFDEEEWKRLLVDFRVLAASPIRTFGGVIYCSA
ncbi:hypothetical protein BYT27DRAFT_7342631 [Phlegmacium glaucopus]|nr:hypothetical protein BYT27DRAFT_7342631 [Phlegmacium glaucopus]